MVYSVTAPGSVWPANLSGKRSRTASPFFYAGLATCYIDKATD
jgi:hypothetical protein